MKPLASWNRRTTSSHFGHLRWDADGTVISSPFTARRIRPRISFIMVPQDGQASSGNTRPRRSAGTFWLLVFVMTTTFVPAKRHDHTLAPKDQLDVNELLADARLEDVHPLARGLGRPADLPSRRRSSCRGCFGSRGRPRDRRRATNGAASKVFWEMSIWRTGTPAPTRTVSKYRLGWGYFEPVATFTTR